MGGGGEGVGSNEGFVRRGKQGKGLSEWVLGLLFCVFGTVEDGKKYASPEIQACG